MLLPRVILTTFLLTATLFASPPTTKRRVLADLDTIKNAFAVKYAPRQWKGEFAGWDLDEEIAAAKEKIEALKKPTLKECQVIIRDFFNSARDYHVGVRFYSTENASLPFMVAGAEGRYFICDIDWGGVSKSNFPFEVGDEILTFDGKPIHDVIDHLRVQEFGDNTFETDSALAQRTLTDRRGSMAHGIPRGTVTITGKQMSTGKKLSARLTWDYLPEKIRDLSKIGAEAAFEVAPHEWNCDLQTALKKSQFFDKLMVYPGWNHSYVGLRTVTSNHTMGSRTSYLPPLGQVVWKSGSDWIFDAYIFIAPSGKRVGYVRLPHYIGDLEEVEEFGLLMNAFERKTDALVIDQLNNPGGSVFYLYALASTLAKKPMQAPRHHIALTQEEVHTALVLLSHLEPVHNDEMAQEVLGEEIGGYPVDYEFVKLMQKFCQFTVDQWNRGKLYTDATHLFGVDKIHPHPRYHYSKPVLLLINNLNFSGGDFFPAILQDNTRAKLMGSRTAGAGGYVLGTTFPNHSGMRSFVMTGSLAERTNHKPIENLGVKPDIPYELTVEDLQHNFAPYVEAIIQEVEKL